MSSWTPDQHLELTSVRKDFFKVNYSILHCLSHRNIISNVTYDFEMIVMARLTHLRTFQASL